MATTLNFSTPIDNLVKVGTYGVSEGQKPAFVISHQKDISIAKIILYSIDDIPHIMPILKSILGVMIPEIGKAYISGTRKILRLDEVTFIVSTEGEARGVLYERLNYNLQKHGVVYNETAALTALRIDGYYIYNMLSNIIEDLSDLPSQINECCYVQIDYTKVICHLNNYDTLFLYLHRGYASEIYARIARLCLPQGLKIL